MNNEEINRLAEQLTESAPDPLMEMAQRIIDSAMDAEPSEDGAENATEQAAPEVPPTNVEMFRGVYADTLYFVDGIVEEYDFYPEILDVFRNGNAKVELKKRYMLKAIDEVWVRKIEDCLPALDEIIRKPSRFIEENDKVLPIELSRNISSRSIKHLSQHTDYISKIEDDGTIIPSKILNVFRDETMLTYENKFVNTLIHRLFTFVDMRYRAAREEGKDEKNTSLDFSESFVHGSVTGKIHFRMEISEEPTDGEHLKNYTYTKDLWQRVQKLYNVCRTYINSSFAKNMERTFIRPPVIRTNAILKNKNLRQCLELWEFIEGYENVGYNLLVQEHLEDIDAQYLRELYATSALQYLIFRYNIKNEFEPNRTLASQLSDHPFTPELTEEQETLSAEEFARTFHTGSAARADGSVDGKPLDGRRRKLLHAVNVALCADAIQNHTADYRRPPRRKHPALCNEVAAYELPPREEDEEAGITCRKHLLIPTRDEIRNRPQRTPKKRSAKKR